MIWYPSNTRTEAALRLFVAVIVLAVASYWAGRCYSTPAPSCHVRCYGINCSKDYSGQCWKIVGGDSTECKWWWVSANGCDPGTCVCDTQNVAITWKMATCTTNPTCTAIQTNNTDANNNCADPMGDPVNSTCCQRCF